MDLSTLLIGCAVVFLCSLVPQFGKLNPLTAASLVLLWIGVSLL